jgi:hypothetical protein
LNDPVAPYNIAGDVGKKSKAKSRRPEPGNCFPNPVPDNGFPFQFG